LCATIVHSAMHTHMNRPNSCLLDLAFNLAFLRLYCVLQFTCVRFSFLELFCVIVYLCAFVVLDLVCSVLCQEIGWEERLQNDLFRVEWDMKP